MMKSHSDKVPFNRIEDKILCCMYRQRGEYTKAEGGISGAVSRALSDAGFDRDPQSVRSRWKRICEREKRRREIEEQMKNRSIPKRCTYEEILGKLSEAEIHALYRAW